MGQKFDIGLNSKINEFAEKFNINRKIVKDDDIFEEFSNYLVVSTILQDDIEEINKISTNKAQGIDGIAIFVNDRLIAEENDLEKIGESEKIKIKIAFIQSTTQNRFNEQKFQSFTDEVINFLIGENKIEPFSSILEELLDEEGDFIDNLIETPLITLYFLSARTNHTIPECKLSIEKNKITNRSELDGKYLLDDIIFWQKKEIKENYKQLDKFHTVSLKFHKNIQLEEREEVEISLLAAIKFTELKKMILTKEENIKEKLFIENPRAHLGNTTVNEDIKNTIRDNKYNPYFIYLNNGITILCDNITKHPRKENEFILTFPRIINGCQTTHILYEEYKQNPNNLDSIEIIAKIIATKNSDLKKQIIFAANNQNSIDKDLQSLNKYHEKIEEYYKGNDEFTLFYERLRGQYSNIVEPYKKINIENLAKVYVSVFLQEPHKMKSNAIKKINKYQEEKKIFNDDKNIPKYYYSGILFYWLNKFLLNRQLNLKSKTMDMHLLLGIDLFLDKECSNIKEKIAYLKTEEKALNIFSTANNFLSKEDYLFEKRGFYSGPKTKKLIEAIKEK